MKRNFILALGLIFIFTMDMNAYAAGVSDIFSAKHYAEKYTDIREAFGDDEESMYQHVMTYGLDEKREISPVLDLVYYRANNPDLEEAFGDDWDAHVQHWFEFGIDEGRDSGRDFDPALYLSAYPDLQAAFGNDYRAAVEHYLEYGMEEGRYLGIRYPETDHEKFDPVQIEYDEFGNCMIREYDDNKRVIKTESYDSAGNKLYCAEFDYYENGEIYHIYRSSANGDYDIIEYYRNGNVYKMEHHYGGVEDYYILWHDTNGTQQKSIYYYKDGKYDITEYNEAGLKTEVTRYTKEGTVYEECEFNSEGGLSIVRHYHPNGHYDVYEYNANGEVINQSYFDSDGYEIRED